MNAESKAELLRCGQQARVAAEARLAELVALPSLSEADAALMTKLRGALQKLDAMEAALPFVQKH